MTKGQIIGIVILIVIVLVAAYFLLAKPAPPPEVTPPPEEKPPEVTPPPEEKPPEKKIKVAIMFDIGGRGDLGFNDMAWLGAERAKKDFGVEVTYVQPASEADYIPRLRDLASSGEYDLIVGVGFLLTDAIDQVADEFPEQKFAIVDSLTPDPNVRGILFKENEGSALVGLLAGLVTETNKVGVVLGMEIPVLYHFEAGFYWGVNMAENLTGKDIDIIYKYTGSFIDRALGKQTSEGMLAQGADVLYNVAGLTGLGVLDAVHDYNVAHDIEIGPPFAIGVDSCQDWMYPGHVIASMMKRVDNGVYFAIRDVVYGNFTGGPIYYGVKEGGVGISKLEELQTFMDIAKEMGAELPDTPENIVAKWQEMRAKFPDEVWSAIEDLEQKIKSGEVEIPFPETPEEIQAIRERYGVGVLGG
ncbi:MAG: sugar-binding protein [Thermoproteota archaeon]|nr:MAG: sugar-binding protein [Candidatus Korarchaeota archaeon]